MGRRRRNFRSIFGQPKTASSEVMQREAAIDPGTGGVDSDWGEFAYGPHSTEIPRDQRCALCLRPPTVYVYPDGMREIGTFYCDEHNPGKVGPDTVIERIATRRTAEMDLDKREAMLLKALAKATMAEQPKLMAELNEVRQLRTARIAADREVDLANAVVKSHLTPVLAHSFGLSKDTDWLANIQTTADLDVEKAMTVEATLWFDRLDPAVLADPDEFRIQAEGVAHVQASQFGEDATRAARAFLDHVAHLHRRVTAAEGGSNQETSDSGVAESGLPDAREPSTDPEVLDNFEPPIAPENEGAHEEAEGDGSEEALQAQGARRTAAAEARRRGLIASRHLVASRRTAAAEARRRGLIASRHLVASRRRTAADDEAPKHRKRDEQGRFASRFRTVDDVVNFVRSNLSEANRRTFDALPPMRRVAVAIRIVREAAEAGEIADDSGAAVSGLPQVEVTDEQALEPFTPWEIDELDGKIIGEGARQRQAQFRAVIQASLRRRANIINSGRPSVKLYLREHPAANRLLDEGAEEYEWGAEAALLDQEADLPPLSDAEHAELWGLNSGYAEGYRDNYGGAVTATRRSRRTAMPNPVDLGVKVGDIFVASWGYDQTNVNFYEVVGLTGASVKVRPVNKKVVESRGPGGNSVVPIPGSYHDRDVLLGIGKSEATKRIQGGGNSRPGFRLSDFAWAFLWDGQPRYETDPMFGH